MGRRGLPPLSEYGSDSLTGLNPRTGLPVELEVPLTPRTFQNISRSPFSFTAGTSCHEGGNSRRMPC